MFVFIFIISSNKSPYIFFNISVYSFQGFRGSSEGEESTCNSGDPDSIPGSGRSSKKGMATHYSIPWSEEPVRSPCPSPTPGAYSNSCPSSQWCHPTMSSSVVPFSSCVQSFPASGSFPVSQFFTSDDQSIGASASILPMNIQDWFPLGWTGWISLQSKGLSRVFSSTTVQKYQNLGAQLYL